jgi:hypothetical protein
MVPEMVADVICATARDAVDARRTTPRTTFNLMTASLSSRELANDTERLVLRVLPGQAGLEGPPLR